MSIILGRDVHFLCDIELHQLTLTADSSHAAQFESYSKSTFWDFDPDKIPHHVCLSFVQWLRWEDSINLPDSDIVFECIMFAGAEEGETLFLGVTICQCTTSWPQWSLWSCGNPNMNAQAICCSPTRRSNRCISAIYSFTISSRKSHCATNWLYATNESGG